MLQSQTRPRTAFQPHLNHHHHSKFYQTPTSFDVNNLDIDFDGGDNGFASPSSSPVSTQSILSQLSGAHTSPLSTFDSIPTIAAPRGSHEGSLFHFSPQRPQSSLGEPASSLFSTTDLMQADTWMPNGLPNGQLTPKSSGRFSHHRESSLSSLGSAGPASPYSHNISNPQIAVTDSLMGDNYGLGNGDELNTNYQLSKFPGVTHDTFFTSFPNYTSADNSAITTYPQIAAVPRRKNDRGLLPPPDHPIGSNRSRPVSVASSIASDSPATPAEEPEEIRRQRNVVTTVPKFDRTMTDVYSDELYSPSFTTASATPAQMSISPNNDLFIQRIQTANNQHLSAQSPISASPRGRSPFRQGSPLAPLPMEFSSLRFGSAQQLREQNKATQDANVVRQHMVRSADNSAPQTISPKDALLDYHDTDESANFPLFPPSGSTGFDADAITKAVSQNQQAFDPMTMDTSNAFNNFLSSQLPHGIQIPQQYPFIAEPRHQSSAPSLSNGSLAPSRMSSAEVESIHSNSPQRPAATSADGGTYTCTYHGCTLRFETPALLQKHKREGHRQAHGLTGTRRPDSAGSTGMTTALLNSQAGPHRCDRINPSTGKPCNTIFSRPYDLTRHEDTIHNARKQKVRCDLCTDEKTFSRADALTRHYRVCHPDVDFPGKQRRRGGQTG